MTPPAPKGKKSKEELADEARTIKRATIHKVQRTLTKQGENLKTIENNIKIYEKQEGCEELIAIHIEYEAEIKDIIAKYEEYIELLKGTANPNHFTEESLETRIGNLSRFNRRIEKLKKERQNRLDELKKQQESAKQLQELTTPIPE